MLAAFIAGSAGVLLIPSVALVLARRRLGLDPFWYALAPVGAATSVIAYLAAMGVWLVWVNVGYVPAALPREEVVARPDVLFVTTIVLGLAAELAKSYGVSLFHTRLQRGMWPVFGASVGAGAGMLQAFWVLASSAWTFGWGLDTIEAKHLWLVPQYLALVGLEAACGGLVLYETARDHRWRGVAIAGTIHGLALLVVALASNSTEVVWTKTALPPVALLAFALATAGGLTLWIKRRGWPV